MTDQRRDGYITKLKDTQTCVNQFINILGVVVEYSFPRRSKGTDFCTILKIEKSGEPGVVSQYFHGKCRRTSNIRSSQDIIFLSNFKMESYNGENYAVFKKDFIKSLRRWSQNSTFDARINQHVVPVKDIKEDFVDLVCKVIHACKVNDDWVLFVCDGTDGPALSLMTIDEEHNPLPLQIEPVPLPCSLLCNFPHVGTVLRVFVDKAYENFGDQIGKLEGWIKLRNLHLTNELGLWKVILGPSTKF